MAVGRPPIPEDDQRRIKRMAEVSRSKTDIAKEVGVSRPTAYKYAREAEKEFMKKFRQ